MDNRKENLKKSLGISEYPWSSDDETDNVDPLNLTRRQPTEEPQTSATNMSRSNGESSASQSTDLPARRAQAKLDRELFWSIINKEWANRIHVRNRPYEARTPPQSTEPRHTSATSPERRIQRSTSADVQRILAFKKLTRSLNAMRASGPNVYPICSRSNQGPSRNPLFTASIRTSGPRRIQTRPNIYINRNGHFSRNNLPTSVGGSEQPIASTSGVSYPPVPPADHTVELDHSDDEIPTTSGLQGVSAMEPRAGESAETSHNTSDGGGGGMSLEEIVEIDAAEEPPAEHDARNARNSHDEQDARDEQHALDESDGRVEQRVDANESDIQLEAIANGNDSVAATPPQAPRDNKRKRDDDAYEVSTVKDFNQSLLRLLECPVCLEWMEPPIAQCRRGHLVCSRCRARLAACPVCRTTFSSVRNRAMEGVSELLRYPCRHGCGREVRLRRRASHEASCLARKYACPAPACKQRAPLPHHHLARHLQSKHADMVKIGHKHKFSMKVSSEHHDDWVIMALQEFFHLRVDVDVRAWGVIVYVAYIGPKCNAKNFMYEITINGQNNARKLVYTRTTHSDLESSSLNVSRQDCFHLTLDQALNFLKFKNRHCDPDRYLDFNIEITKCEENTDDANETTET